MKPSSCQHHFFMPFMLGYPSFYSGHNNSPSIIDNIRYEYGNKRLNLFISLGSTNILSAYLRVTFLGFFLRKWLLMRFMRISLPEPVT